MDDSLTRVRNARTHISRWNVTGRLTATHSKRKFTDRPLACVDSCVEHEQLAREQRQHPHQLKAADCARRVLAQCFGALMCTWATVSRYVRQHRHDKRMAAATLSTRQRCPRDGTPWYMRSITRWRGESAHRPHAGATSCVGAASMRRAPSVLAPVAASPMHRRPCCRPIQIYVALATTVSHRILTGKAHHATPCNMWLPPVCDGRCGWRLCLLRHGYPHTSWHSNCEAVHPIIELETQIFLLTPATQIGAQMPPPFG